MEARKLFSDFQARSRFHCCSRCHIDFLRGLSQDQCHCFQRSRRSGVSSAFESIVIATADEVGERVLQHCFGILGWSCFSFRLAFKLSLEGQLQLLLKSFVDVGLGLFGFRSACWDSSTSASHEQSLHLREMRCLDKAYGWLQRSLMTNSNCFYYYIGHHD